MQNRPFAGLFSRSCCSQPQKIFASDLPQRITRNDLLTFWPKHGTQNVCIHHKLDSSNFQATGCTNPGVPGRFFNRSSGQGLFAGPCTSCYRLTGAIGLDHQLRQVHPHTCKGASLFGNSVEPMDEQEISSEGKTAITGFEVEGTTRKETHQSQGASKSGGSSQFREFYCSYWQIELSSFAESPKQVIEIEQKRVPRNPSRCSREFTMVDPELLTVNTYSHASTDALSNNRCVRYCLGCSIRQSSLDRFLVRAGKRFALQPKGNAGSTKSFTRSLSAPEPEYSTCSMRQSHGDCISATRRRNKVSPSDGTNVPSVSHPGPIQNSFEYLPHPRHIQRPCRPLVEASSSSGVAPAAELHGESVRQVGHAGHGLVRFEQSPCRDKLRLDPPERSRCAVSRRLLSDVGLSTSVDIPTSLPYPQSIETSQPGSRNIPVSSTSLGACLLASGSQSPSPSSSFYPTPSGRSPDRRHDRTSSPESPRHDARSVEMWGWSEKLAGWNDRQLELIGKSWRPSTRRTYNSAWKRWLTWSKKHNVDPCSPNGSDVGRFLSDLHLIEKLSYNSILLHKSAVSTLCNPDTSGQISANILVKQVLKSIALQKTTRHKPPIWNIDCLAAHLGKYNVNVNNIFQTQRHTATLLLLCSGRRIHDLTLLNVDPNHCVMSDDCIVLWPSFGSKTDSADHRQSGWKFTANTSNQNLDPVFWIRQTINLLQNQREAANIKSLFVNIRGEAKAASRAVIAGWVKTLLVDAGITAPPGSIRSAVASKNWLDNYPLEEILSRGNWRSQNTFCRFYRREVMPATSSSLVTTLFNPID